MKSNTKQNQLAAALREAVPSQQTHSESPAALPVVERGKASASPQPKKQRGKNVHFFLHEEDTRLIRGLAAWLSGQGERPSDSLVVKAALRAVKADGNFLKSYRQATQLDGRLKQHRTP